ncbi:ADP-glyceromanno-heptose 6-epimerase [Candidatus Paracaedibacter symbiosus]|uniref:ADP-glyceromanno-heptose 6-epimerase n=1 Tax=Candidatus Paracaedibacter symbiosus TaxID=244582 RepID=UPI000B16521E|nr:ADP-glyceromanno-heptose 6-epimerase [Candidatus Paracaedibacter symbiosus]
MILITGATGFIGSNYAHLLATQGEEIVVCDWFGHHHKWKNLSGLNLADIVVPEQALEWLKHNKISLVVHMGAISTTTESDVDYLLKQNFEFSKQLWNWCADAQIRFIYASSAATYGAGEHGFVDDNSIDYLQKLRPLNAYGWSKNLFDMWAVTHTARGHHPPQWAGLKFFNVYGPRETHKGPQRSVAHQLYEQAGRGETIKLFKSYNPSYPDGGQLRDFVFVDDCCNVIEWLRQTPAVSGILNVGTGKARSFTDITHALSQATGQEVKVEFIDMPAQIRQHYQYFTQSDMTRLRQVGYPQEFTSLEQGVAEYVRFLKDNPGF